MERTRNKNIIMSYEEHAVCSNWVSDYNIGFKYYDLNRDDVLCTDFGKGYNTICFLLNGSITLRYNDRDIFVEKESMFFLPSSLPCKIIAESKAFVLTNSFNKPINAVIDTCERMSLESIEAPYNKDNEAYNPVLPIKKSLFSFLNLLSKLIADGVYCKHFHNEEFNKFLFLLRFYYTKEEIGNLFAPILGEDMEFKHLVLQYYHRTDNIKELADLCGYSLARFNRLFAQNFHETPYKWMQKKRLQQVIIRLSDKHVNIANIAKDLGFSSPGHLTVFCKEFLHLTPSQFRKQLHNRNKIGD
ncbi:MAG: AraC family transcriptional regulator [Bacteroidales bacterium]|jgi:AraC-like DNA-binding protein|nr:AraC family transcriptional regulator [Bacteroidales bacterium]